MCVCFWISDVSGITLFIRESVMEGLSITTLILIGGVLFIFRNMLAKSAEMGEKEFNTMTRAQEIRLHKTRIQHTKDVIKLKDQDVMSDAEFDKIFNVINSKEEI